METSARILGTHMSVDLYGCNTNILNNCTEIQALLEEAAKQANVTVLNTFMHQFSPQGIVGVYIHLWRCCTVTLSREVYYE